MNLDQFLSSVPFSDTAMGNHATARAMVESGTRVITTYPGSPTPEIAEILNRVPSEKRPYYFEYSVNEKVALELACGASMNGHLSSVFFKSVGLNVAMDSMIQLPMFALIGGMVIIVGDDPGANSSQNEQDNRHFARMAHMPLLEPSSPTESYKMYLEAARLSKTLQRPVLIRTTTHTAHAREQIDFGPADPTPPDWSSKFRLENGPYWPIAGAVFPLKQRMLEKEVRFAELSEESVFNEIIPAVDGTVQPRGVISSGLPSLAVLENIAASNAPVDVLRLGFTHPLPKYKITDFLKDRTEVLIVEELDRVMETEIKAMAFDAGVSCRILTRTNPEDLSGELTVDRTASILHGNWPALFKEEDKILFTGALPARLPQLCPGCGHRTAFYGVAEALAETDITVGDIGCHTLGALPPHNLGQIVLSMGHSVSTASGLALHNADRGTVAFVGDGTLFHAGLPGIINAAVNNHNVTLVVLENGTTAMTGHQPRPGTGEVGAAIPLPELLKMLGVQFVRDVDAYNVKGVAASVREGLDYKGFAVVIARHPCMLQVSGKQKKKSPNLKIPKITVDQDACTKCGICVSEFGCPSFEKHDAGKVTVASDVCIGDGSCVQTCPSGALKREGWDQKR